MRLKGGNKRNAPAAVIISAAPSHAGWIMSPNTWRDVIYDAMRVAYGDSNPITHTILRMYGFSDSTNRLSAWTGYGLPRHAHTRIPAGRVSISTAWMEWKCTLAIRSHDRLEWFHQLGSCVAVCTLATIYGNLFLMKSEWNYPLVIRDCSAALEKVLSAGFITLPLSLVASTLEIWNSTLL